MPGKIFLSTPGGGTRYAYTPADVAGSTGPLTVLGGTLTGASTPFLNLSQTWNNAATTFTGVLVNVTDTASNSASLLQDWQVGGVKKASVTKTGGFYSWNAFTDASNYERGVFDWTTTANTLTIGTQNAGTGSARGINFATGGTTAMAISSAQAVSIVNGLTITGAGAFLDSTAGGMSIRANNVTGALYFGTGGTTLRWGVESTGNFIPVATDTYTLGKSGNAILGLYLSKTITSAGTTGAQTINKATGSVNFAAAATSLVVTNSLVTTSSVIVATVGTNDTTMKTVNAVAAAGSFTLTANAAATAETRVNFVVLN